MYEFKCNNKRCKSKKKEDDMDELNAITSEYTLAAKMLTTRNEMLSRGFCVDAIVLGQNEFVIFKSFINRTSNYITDNETVGVGVRLRYMGVEIKEHSDLNYFGLLLKL